MEPERPETRGSASTRLFLHLHRAEVALDLLQRDPACGYLGSGACKGEGPGRIYLVEPTVSFMDDPNVTDRKYPGNPTKSYRSWEPLRLVSEHPDWQGHSPEEIQAMDNFIADKEPIDD